MKDVVLGMSTQLGRPADILDGLAAEGVRVVGGCFFPRVEARVAHVTVADADEDAVHRVAATSGALVLDSRQVLVVDPAPHGGAAAVARKVADAGVIVNVAYFGARGEVIIATSDLPTAARALGIE